ncbi:MAG: LysR family transcriptional regulator [Pyrinomonadaceae bacterium]|nr:LysR family transcriptional regulator [Pyrinomonadaceae bacterium]
MELWQLRTFRVVAETLNFTRAAERLNLTQSAVSHQIKALEAELGEPLFIRAKRGVKLSQAGKIALEYVERILDDAEAMRERIYGREHSPAGRVRAAAATQAFVHLFATLFESFMRLHPGIELSFRTTVSTDQTITDILNGAADVGFASMPVYSPALRITELFEDELVVIVGREHPLAHHQETTIEQIERERFILYERGASIRRATDEFFKRVKIGPELALESNDTYFIKLMVQHGLGISLLPLWAVRDEVAAGKLAELKISGHQLRRSVAMLSLGRFQPSPTRAFLAFIMRHKEKLQQMADGQPVLPEAENGSDKL